MSSVTLILESCDGSAPHRLTERIVLGPGGRTWRSCGSDSAECESKPVTVEAAQILLCKLASAMQEQGPPVRDAPTEGSWRLTLQCDSVILKEFWGRLSSKDECMEGNIILWKLFPYTDVIGFGERLRTRYRYPLHPVFNAKDGWVCRNDRISSDLAEAMSDLLDIPFCRPDAVNGGSSDFLLETYVAGLCYVDGIVGILEGLRYGDVLRLKREPFNSHDQRAIGVWTDSAVRIGFIPARHNIVPSNLMDQGYDLYALVDKVDASEPALTIEVFRRNETCRAVLHYTTSMYSPGFMLSVPDTMWIGGFIDFDKEPVHLTYKRTFG